MSQTRFCTECGQKTKARHPGVLRTLCVECKPRFRFARFAVFLVMAVGFIMSFIVGRYTAPAEPFAFIGVPVEPGSLAILPNQTKPLSTDSSGTPSTTAAEGLITSCEAPTKAGHPCRRKVHGWGYCWQHRDKFGKKPLPKEPDLLNKPEKAGTGGE